jgi:hypothetical protein
MFETIVVFMPHAFQIIEHHPINACAMMDIRAMDLFACLNEIATTFQICAIEMHIAHRALESTCACAIKVIKLFLLK